jgi:hypothetical protein
VATEPRVLPSDQQARHLATLLLRLSLTDSLHTTPIPHVTGPTRDRTALVTTRPCCAHHTIADAGRIGGGQVRGRGRRPSRTTACASWRHGPSVAAMCAKSCVSPLRRVSQPYHFRYRPDGTA